ncbi:FAD-binding oxidoreductase [Pseudodonghicola flavimaris]|uniref:FAD-binding oxidoreductase n=1 Tax=Pseudodonghicola flavimaris TaxID=3050036 RepID=A0ABT7EXP3_9RHOB|nr:FAD-binding oxidoreductase [Pseudodonghicola flavimaris]MDK3017103.1 FAD-binding oxidoreductase [Pseudodonghicola flavimaris]
MTLNPADDAFAARLRQSLPEAVFRSPEPRYLEEPRGRWAGQCGVLALPRDVDEVSALVTAAAAARVPVVPYGGGTGLVGGQIAPEGPAPLIVSLERMNAIRGVYPTENVLIAEAGAILAEVQLAAREAGRLFPLSLAAEGTARIGGNLSTNAGGTGVLRYGNARDLCLGLEAVLPDGRIWHGLSRLRKDNTGYDLRDLLIGAEGTLGIITAATLKLYPQPAAQGTAIFVVPDPEAAIALLSLAHARLGEAVSAFELIAGQGLTFLAENLPEVRQPFDQAPEWCVLMEVGLPRGLDPEEALADLFEAALEEGLTSDGLIAQSQAQRDDFWSVREHIPEANRRVGAVSSHDISVPISRIPEFIRRGDQVVAGLGGFRVNCFGHIGDGNLHYNVFPEPGRSKADHANQVGAVKRAVHDLVHEMGGSVSAEHGIGRLKVEDLERYGDPVRLDAMRAIKAALDPAGIMNPGAVLRA